MGNDLIRRQDAINAIRKTCILDHLPFRSGSPEGQRTMEALMAIRKVPAVTSITDADKYSCDNCGNHYLSLTICSDCIQSVSNPRPTHWIPTEEGLNNALQFD